MRLLLFQVEQQQSVIDQPVTSTTVQSASTGQGSPEKQRKSIISYLLYSKPILNVCIGQE